MKKENTKQANIPYESIYRLDDGIYMKESDDTYKIADYISIKKTNMNIDTNEIVAEIEYDAFRKRRTILIPRTDYMNSQKLIQYAGKGLDIMKDNVDNIVRHFRNEEELAPVNYQHDKIGFGYFEGKEVYKLYHSIGVSSTYCGPYDLKPKGSKEEYLNMLNEQVIGHAPLELILIMALSAVIIGYIGEERSLYTLIVHIKANSSTGKTTAIRLGISAFGYADTKHNGLVGTYNGTSNALIKQLTGIKGVPFAFDELSMSQEKDLTNMIYTIANGTDKARLNSNADLKERENWHTTAFSTGEKSLINSAKKNVGIQIRVIEFEDVVFTKDAENAEAISKVIQQNYGHLAYDFVESIFNIGKEKLLKKYDQFCKYMVEIFKGYDIEDSYTERRAKYFAVILLTGKQLEKVLNTKFHWKEIQKLIVEIERKSLLKRNFHITAIEYIKQFVSINYSKFLIEGKPQKVGSSYWGRISIKNEGVEVEMLPLKFKEMIQQGGFEDETVVLKELKQNGLLNCEKDRYTRKRKTLTGITTEMYVIKLPK